MSYLPEEFHLSPELEERDTDIIRMYNQIARFVRPIINTYTPTLEASGSNGTVTYTKQVGIYHRQGSIVDIWIDISWSNWTGGSGDIRVLLPSKIMNVDAIFPGSNLNANLTYANASDTWVSLRGDADTNFVRLMSGRYNAAYGAIQFQATGTIIGHFRYLSQENA